MLHQTIFGFPSIDIVIFNYLYSVADLCISDYSKNNNTSSQDYEENTKKEEENVFNDNSKKRKKMSSPVANPNQISEEKNEDSIPCKIRKTEIELREGDALQVMNERNLESKMIIDATDDLM